ncbi:MAG: histidine phosphatase family protein [Geminicoccaceae bacterium]
MRGQVETTSRWRARLAALGLALTAAHQPAAAAAAFPIERLDQGGYVLMVRHARAPGTGDPDHFRLGDCATQRNLDDEGRAQARRLGARLRAAGIAAAEVYSSQWCRCLETAALMDLGPVEELPALNSFHQRPADRQPNLEALREFLAGLPADGPLVVLVTHQVTIAAITGRGVISGEAVILEADGTEEPRVVGRIEPG